MFDIGFMELAMIGVVALLVIGPERLPLVARKLGIWVGKARRFVSHVQADFKQEVDKAEELKRLLDEQSKIQSYHEILEQGGEDEHGRVPVERLPHAAKTFADSEPVSARAVEPQRTVAASVSTSGNAVANQNAAANQNVTADMSKLREDHDKAK